MKKGWMGIVVWLAIFFMIPVSASESFDDPFLEAISIALPLRKPLPKDAGGAVALYQCLFSGSALYPDDDVDSLFDRLLACNIYPTSKLVEGESTIIGFSDLYSIVLQSKSIDKAAIQLQCPETKLRIPICTDNTVAMIISGIRVLNCVFEGNATEMVANGYVAIKLKADSRVFEDIEVSGCRFTNYFQGIYTQGTDGLQVKNNVFNGTTHNAIAVQTGASNEVRGEVVIEENIIKNANDRAIRLGNAAAAEKITIQNNVMVNSGDADGELIKGNFPSSSVVSLEHNYWAGKDVSTAVANEEVRPQTTGIAGGTFNEPVIEYVAQGSTAISYAVTEGEAPTTLYAVGNDAETAANNAIAGATITVFKGDSITVPDQVNVINQTGGDITVNGATVANNQQVEAHSISTDWTYNNAAHWHECSVCHQKKTGEAPHTLEWKVDKEPTETENGSKHEECTVCGYMGATGEIPATGETPPAYQIIQGANGSWTQNTDGTLAFRANGPFDKFTGVKVDGRLLNAGSYTAKSDSTVITLKAGYLKTLSNGAHTLTVVYTDGECSTGFTVKAAAALPKTGDAGQPALWLALLALAAAGLSAALYGKKSCGGKA